MLSLDRQALPVRNPRKGKREQELGNSQPSPSTHLSPFTYPFTAPHGPLVRDKKFFTDDRSLIHDGFLVVAKYMLYSTLFSNRNDGVALALLSGLKRGCERQGQRRRMYRMESGSATESARRPSGMGGGDGWGRARRRTALRMCAYQISKMRVIGAAFKSAVRML